MLHLNKSYWLFTDMQGTITILWELDPMVSIWVDLYTVYLDVCASIERFTCLLVILLFPIHNAKFKVYEAQYKCIWDVTPPEYRSTYFYRCVTYLRKEPGTVILRLVTALNTRLITSYSGPDISFWSLFSYFSLRSSLEKINN